MKSAISIAALALACTASAAQAASVSTISTQVPGKVPGCEASFDARFDAASLITNNSAMRPDTADGQMREAWRLTPLCEGEDIIIGDGFHIVGPKASGESIPSNVTGLVGETVALSKAVPTTPAGKAAHARALAHGKSYMKQHPDARKNARGSFANCTITAYSPQWSAGKTRTGGTIVCSTLRDLQLEVTTNVSAGYNGGGLPFYYNNGTTTSVTGWANWFNCYAVNSYRGWAYGAALGTGYEGGDVSSYVTGAGKGCA